MTSLDAMDAGRAETTPIGLPWSSPRLTIPDDAGIESCSVYSSTNCALSVGSRCTLYDVENKRFVEDPDPVTRRAFLYDRYHDLYHQPSGQTSVRTFNTSVFTSTPESVWSDVSLFSRYSTMGDAAGHTGGALTAAAMRYASTGTLADHDRMAEKTRATLSLFDVTGVTGYLARYHFLLLPNNAANTDRVAVEFGERSSYAHDYHDIDLAQFSAAPEEYRTGVAGASGQSWRGTPMWRGNPTIDQYAGILTAIPFVYGLLRDDTLRRRLADHVTCYLKRLRRIEVRNLNSNPELQAALGSLTAGGRYDPDPSAPDVTKVDTVVLYGLVQPNSQNRDTFDKTCPDKVEVVASRVIDASESNALVLLAGLALDLNAGQNERATGLDHAYFVNVRAADAVHMIGLAALAYAMTGDSQYLRFLEDDLLRGLGADGVARTLGTWRTSKWCREYYPEHITFPPWWSLLAMLGPCPLRDTLALALEDGYANKIMALDRNLKFALMFAGQVPGRGKAAEADALAQLPRPISI